MSAKEGREIITWGLLQIYLMEWWCLEIIRAPANSLLRKAGVLHILQLNLSFCLTFNYVQSKGISFYCT